MRKLVPVLLLLVLGIVGGAIFLVLSGDTSGPGDGTSESVDELALEDDAGTTSRRSKPDAPSRRWVPKGDGRVTGIVLEYGSDRPVSGITVTLSAGLPGPNETLTATTSSDGSFVFSAAINFDQWAIQVAAAPPLGELVLAGVEVVEDQETNVGVLYVTPSFEVPGIVVDERGDPVAGATVRALRPRATGSTNDFLRLIRELPQQSPSVDAATTDAQGQFVLSKVPAGRFDFELSGPSHALRVERGVFVTPATVDRPLRFVLSRGYELPGRVIRPAGGSVEGIQIVAFEEPRGESGLFQLDKRFATTDENGEFQLRNLAAGDFVVTAVPEGRPFTIIDDVTLPGTEFVEIVLEGDAWLEGLVSDGDGKPIVDAEVYLVGQDDGNPSVGNAVTGADGRYRIDGLKSGPTQFFIVQAAGFASYPDDLMSVFRGRGQSGLTLESGANEKDVSLKVGATLTGIVLTQGTDEPVPGARVSLLSPQSLFGGGRSATTDDAGRFELTSVPLGPAVVMAEKEGYYQPGVTQQSIGMIIMGAMNRSGSEPQKDTGRGVSISVTEPGEVLERELVLAAGSTLRGVVLTPDGEPVPGAEVSLRSDEGGGMLGGLLSMMGRTEPRITAADGTFAIPGPPPGQKMAVVASTRGWLDGKSEPMSAKPGDTVDGITITLRNGATLTGKVTDAQGGGVEGALVRWLAEPEDGNEWSLRWQLGRADPTVTGEDGTFRIAQIEPGKIVIQVSHVSMLSTSKSGVNAEDGKDVTVDFRLEGGVRLEGSVARPDGSPAVGARVRVNRNGGWNTPSDPYGSSPNQPTVGADGRFTLEGLPPGTYTLNARQDGFAQSADVTWAGDGPVALRLEPAFRIAGTVRFNDGRVAGGMRVTANRTEVDDDGNRSSESVQSVNTADDGSFSIENLPAGEYDIEVGQAWWGGNDGPSFVPRTISAVAAGTEGLQIEVTSGMEIAGKVTMPDGSVPTAGFIRANRIVEGPDDSAGPLQRNAMLQDDGTFVIDGLKAGKYQITVQVEGVAARALQAEAGSSGHDVQLSIGGSIEGTATTASGAPAAGANVWANGPGGSGNAVVDENGRFKIGGLGEGAYTVQVWLQAGSTAQTGKVEGIDVSDGSTASGISVTLAEQ